MEAIGGYEAALARAGRAAGHRGSGAGGGGSCRSPTACSTAASSAVSRRSFTTPLDIVIIDDDQGGAWPASPNNYVTHALQDADVAVGPGGSRIVLAFAEPRASKGRAGFGAGVARAAGGLRPRGGGGHSSSAIRGSAPRCRAARRWSWRGTASG